MDEKLHYWQEPSPNNYWELKKLEVDRAYNTRPYKTYDPDRGIWLEDIPVAAAESVDVQDLVDAGYAEEDIIVVCDLALSKGQVTVEDWEDYPALLELAIDKIFQPGQLTAQQKAAMISEILAHEGAHRAAGLGIDGFSMEFGVGFAEDSNVQHTDFVPFILPRGRILLPDYQRLLMAPDVKSATDERFTSQDRQPPK